MNLTMPGSAGFLAGGLLLWFGSTSTLAAEADVIEEIVVTAQKREQSLQDVAASISAISAQDLEFKGLKDMRDLQFAVPSLHFKEGLGEPSISIRGVGAFATQPGVATSLGGIYQTRSTLSQLYQLDMERVEVLRGPQGTLYGRNSNGGVVNFIPARPTETFEALLRAGYAEFEEYNVQAVISGPVTERVRFRVAADHREIDDGWVDNLNPGGKDLMQGRFNSIRGQLDVDLTDAFSANLIYAYSELQGPLDHFSAMTENKDLLGSPATDTQARPDAVFSTEPHEIYADTKNDSDRSYQLFGMTLEWDLEWGTIKSITAHQTFDDRFIADRDQTALSIYDTDDDSQTESFTQEINVIGGNDAFDWVIGVFYLDEDYERHLMFDILSPALSIPVPARLDFNQSKFETESLSFFADATVNLTDRARVSLGLRYNEDEIDEFHQNNLVILPGTPFEGVVPVCDKAESETWDSTTGRVVFQYDVHDSGNVYVSYSTGFKAGGVVGFECTPPYNPEEIDSYEIGYKATFGGGRTSVSASFFYYDYTDFQVFQVTDTATTTVNADSADIQGFEFETSSLLSDAWSISFGLTLLDAEFGNFNSLDSMFAALGSQNVKGNPLPFAPSTSINLGIAYTSAAPWGGTLFLSADAAYRSRTQFREFDVDADSQSAYTIVNLNAVWESDDGRWQTRLFAKNATDEEYRTFTYAAAASGNRAGSWGIPRQAGFEVTRKFGD